MASDTTTASRLAGRLRDMLDSSSESDSEEVIIDSPAVL